MRDYHCSFNGEDCHPDIYEEWAEYRQSEFPHWARQQGLSFLPDFWDEYHGFYDVADWEEDDDAKFVKAERLAGHFNGTIAKLLENQLNCPGGVCVEDAARNFLNSTVNDTLAALFGDWGFMDTASEALNEAKNAFDVDLSAAEFILQQRNSSMVVDMLDNALVENRDEIRESVLDFVREGVRNIGRERRGRREDEEDYDDYYMEDDYYMDEKDNYDYYEGYP